MPRGNRQRDMAEITRALDHMRDRIPDRHARDRIEETALTCAEMGDDNRQVVGVILTMTDQYTDAVAAHSRNDRRGDRYERSRDEERDRGYRSDEITEAEMLEEMDRDEEPGWQEHAHNRGVAFEERRMNARVSRFREEYPSRSDDLDEGDDDDNGEAPPGYEEGKLQLRSPGMSNINASPAIRTPPRRDEFDDYRACDTAHDGYGGRDQFSIFSYESDYDSAEDSQNGESGYGRYCGHGVYGGYGGRQEDNEIGEYRSRSSFGTPPWERRNRY